MFGKKFWSSWDRSLRMRVRLAIAGILFLLPWGMSLICVQVSGRADNAEISEKEEQAGEEEETEQTEQTERVDDTGGIVDGTGNPNGAEIVNDTGNMSGAEHVGGTGNVSGVGNAGKNMNEEMGVSGNTGDRENIDVVDEKRTRRILLVRDEIRTYLSLEAYLPGVLLCEIDPFVELETLKCQAVIARTYLYRLMGERTEIEESQLDVDYVESRMGKFEYRAGKQSQQNQQNQKNQQNRLEYKSMTQAQREQIAEGMERCRQAVMETEGIVLTCENQYILPMFHASSAGRTRDGGEEYPYLRPVESRWDKKEKNWQTTYRWSQEEFAGKIRQIGDEGDLTPEELAKKIQIVKRDQSGYVEWIQIGNRTYEGETVRAVLDLPSSCFSLGKADGQTGNDGARNAFVQAVVNGSGHGYGLSQAGAEHMAKEGWGYEEILSYYYTGIELIREPSG